MIIQKGKKNTAIVYADKIDKATKAQIASLLRMDAYSDYKIRFMPDVHAGRYVPVGTTMTLKGRIAPTILGTDIGCGIQVTRIRECQVDFNRLDAAVRALIPSGVKIHEKPISEYRIDQLRCIEHVNGSRAMKSIGTLGGGNHFIEMDRCKDGTLLLVVHSGTRSLGNDVLQYYQKVAFKDTCRRERKCSTSFERDDCCDYSFAIGGNISVSTEDAVLRDEHFESYLNDVKIVSSFADYNRRVISHIICKTLDFQIIDQFTCVHNYIDYEHGILRKGAISARLGERVAIPLNMRDGVVLGIGRGNAEWNFSASHGAGRSCNRNEAMYRYTVEEFQKEMNGIYTTTATQGSLDECPMVYKSFERILPFLKETVDIFEIAKPIYNFKAC